MLNERTCRFFSQLKRLAYALLILATLLTIARYLENRSARRIKEIFIGATPQWRMNGISSLSGWFKIHD